MLSFHQTLQFGHQKHFDNATLSKNIDQLLVQQELNAVEQNQYSISSELPFGLSYGTSEIVTVEQHQNQLQLILTIKNRLIPYAVIVFTIAIFGLFHILFYDSASPEEYNSSLSAFSFVYFPTLIFYWLAFLIFCMSEKQRIEHLLFQKIQEHSAQ